MIPFNIFGDKVLTLISKPLIGIGQRLEKFNKQLSMDLKFAQAKESTKEYIAKSIVLSLIYGLVVFLLLYLVGIKFTDYEQIKLIVISLAFAIVFFFVFYQYLKMYPRLMVAKKVKDLEQNLIFGLRTMLIQIRSGVSIYDALVTVSEGNYGELSNQIKWAVERVGTGEDMEKVLNELAMRLPSPYFRRAMWQIANSLKTGADLGNVVEHIISDLLEEEKVEIKKYGSKLRVYTLLYMMVGSIIPTLGITIIIIISTFPKVEITESLFWILLGILVVFEVMFVGFVKHGRSSLIQVA